VSKVGEIVEIVVVKIAPVLSFTRTTLEGLPDVRFMVFVINFMDFPELLPKHHCGQHPAGLDRFLEMRRVPSKGN
jgi:hypothetical protein